MSWRRGGPRERSTSIPFWPTPRSVRADWTPYLYRRYYGDQIARILGDVASLAYKCRNRWPRASLPVPGKKAGERTEFDDPRMANTTIR